MSPSRKKAIVRLLAGDFLPGYLAPSRFLCKSTPEGTASLNLDLLDLDGRTIALPLAEVKLVCFVRDFNRDDRQNPERLTRRTFLSRPRAEGLWLRLTFAAGDVLEGVARQDLTLMDSLLEDRGLFLVPPDERANTHRIYVPRSAINALEVLGVINAPGRKPTSRSPFSDQPTLFPS